MSLSPREERVLATLEEGLRADDPGLAAALTGLPFPAPPVPDALRPRRALPLVGVLLALVAAVAAARPGPGGTAAVSAGGVVPWLVLAARPTGHRPAAWPRSLPARARYAVGGAAALLVAVAVLPPAVLAVLGLGVLVVGVHVLAMRLLGRTGRTGP